MEKRKSSKVNTMKTETKTSIPKKVEKKIIIAPKKTEKPVVPTNNRIKINSHMAYVYDKSSKKYQLLHKGTLFLKEINLNHDDVSALANALNESLK